MTVALQRGIGLHYLHDKNDLRRFLRRRWRAMRGDALGEMRPWDQAVERAVGSGSEIGKTGGESRALHGTGLVAAAQRVGLQRNVLA